MISLEKKCPQCGGELGAFDMKRGIPCVPCGVFFKTAWRTAEDGKRAQYLTPVADEKRGLHRTSMEKKDD